MQRPEPGVSSKHNNLKTFCPQDPFLAFRICTSSKCIFFNLTAFSNCILFLSQISLVWPCPVTWVLFSTMILNSFLESTGFGSKPNGAWELLLVRYVGHIHGTRCLESNEGLLHADYMLIPLNYFPSPYYLKFLTTWLTPLSIESAFQRVTISPNYHHF